MYNPMLFFIYIIPIDYFLGHMFVQFCEIDWKVENNWEILIL